MQQAALRRPIRQPLLHCALGHPRASSAIKLLMLSNLIHRYIHRCETRKDSGGHTGRKVPRLFDPSNPVANRKPGKEHLHIIEWINDSKKAFLYTVFVIIQRTALFTGIWALNCGKRRERGSRNLGICMSAHLKQILRSRPSLLDGRMKFVLEYKFPNLSEVYKDMYRQNTKHGEERGEQGHRKFNHS